MLLFFAFLTAQSQYEPTKIFLPDFYKHKGDNIRSASGKPSSDYWQNEADYTVKASFNVETHLLKGDVQSTIQTIARTNWTPCGYKWIKIQKNWRLEEIG